MSSPRCAAEIVVFADLEQLFLTAPASPPRDSVSPSNAARLRALRSPHAGRRRRHRRGLPRRCCGRRSRHYGVDIPRSRRRARARAAPLVRDPECSRPPPPAARRRAALPHRPRPRRDAGATPTPRSARRSTASPPCARSWATRWRTRRSKRAHRSSRSRRSSDRPSLLTRGLASWLAEADSRSISAARCLLDLAAAPREVFDRVAPTGCSRPIRAGRTSRSSAWLVRALAADETVLPVPVLAGTLRAQRVALPDGRSVIGATHALRWTRPRTVDASLSRHRSRRGARGRRSTSWCRATLRSDVDAIVAAGRGHRWSARPWSNAARCRSSAGASPTSTGPWCADRRRASRRRCSGCTPRPLRASGSRACSTSRSTRLPARDGRLLLPRPQPRGRRRRAHLRPRRGARPEHRPMPRPARSRRRLRARLPSGNPRAAQAARAIRAAACTGIASPSRSPRCSTWGPTAIQAIARRLAPATRHLGLEKVVARLRLRDRARDGRPRAGRARGERPDRQATWRSRVRAPRTSAARAGEPTTSASVVEARRRRLVYPYEIVRMLTGGNGAGPIGSLRGVRPRSGARGHARVAWRDGRTGRTRPASSSGSSARRPTKVPEGMRRVLILSDPTRDMGALAAPECDRIVAAIDLAERRAASGGVDARLERGAHRHGQRHREPRRDRARRTPHHHVHRSAAASST